MNFIFKESKREYLFFKAICNLIKFIGKKFNIIRPFLGLFASFCFIYIYYYREIGRYVKKWHILSPFSDMLFRKDFAGGTKVMIIIVAILIWVVVAYLSKFFIFIVTNLYLYNKKCGDVAYERMTNERHKEDTKKYLALYEEFLYKNSLSKEDCSMLAFEQFRFQNANLTESNNRHKWFNLV